MRSARSSLARSFSMADTLADLRAAGRFFCQIAGLFVAPVAAIALAIQYILP